MVLNLETLRTGILGLTPEACAFYLQACTVCLVHSNHINGVNAILSETYSDDIQLNWTSIVDKATIKSWGDMQEATEYGATAIAILLAKELTEYTCIERSSKGTGFDYWLGEEDDIELFQRKARLEISGILREATTNTLEQRVKIKEEQTNITAHTNMKAHICITEFSNPKCAYKII